MKFSDKKAVGCLQPITLGGTHIYTSYTGGKPAVAGQRRGIAAASPNFFRFGQQRRAAAAATAAALRGQPRNPLLLFLQ